MRTVKSTLAVMLAAAALGSASAQSAYPEKPVRLIVPSSPSGGTDTTARILSPRISELLGQQIVIENRPGAATRIGAGHVAKSAPDGYTLLITPSTLVIAPSVYKDMGFDPLKDFVPITRPRRRAARSRRSSPDAFAARSRNGRRSSRRPE